MPTCSDPRATRVTSPAPRSLDQLVSEAAAQIDRLDATTAHAVCAAGEGLIVDIRSADARRRDGVIPGSVHIPRTVLEWRVAVDSPWRNPYLAGLDQRLILVCDHGCSSILAAANLVALGLKRAGDVIGGFEAWAAGGLPVVACPPPATSGLPGTGPPDQSG
jgi:rhodanese-related sulfurtransferase